MLLLFQATSSQILWLLWYNLLEFSLTFSHLNESFTYFSELYFKSGIAHSVSFLYSEGIHGVGGNGIAERTQLGKCITCTESCGLFWDHLAYAGINPVPIESHLWVSVQIRPWVAIKEKQSYYSLFFSLAGNTLTVVATLSLSQKKRNVLKHMGKTHF